MLPNRSGFDKWIKKGILKGWCGPPVCHTHDGLPISDIESDEMEFEDICIHVIRLYGNDFEKFDVETDHSPSVWRQMRYVD